MPLTNISGIQGTTQSSSIILKTPYCVEHISTGGMATLIYLKTLHSCFVAKSPRQLKGTLSLTLNVHYVWEVCTASSSALKLVHVSTPCKERVHIIQNTQSVRMFNILVCVQSTQDSLSMG